MVALAPGGATDVQARIYATKLSGGTGLSTIDLVAGRVDAAIVAVLTAKAFIETGKLRVLGISTRSVQMYYAIFRP